MKPLELYMLRLALFIFCFIWTPAFGAGFEILVVQNEVTEFSQRFISGFSSKSNEKITVLKSNRYNGKALSQQIKKRTPDLVLSLGEIPIYTAIAELPAIPFIVADLYSLDLENRSNVILIEDRLPIFEEVSMLKLLFPKLNSIGTAYNPDYTEEIYEELKQATQRLKIKLSALKISTEDDIGAYIAALQDKIQAFYFISDFSTKHPKSTDALYAFAKENRIPIHSTQFDHIDKGALITVSADPILMGSLAWERAYQIIHDGKVSNRKIFLDPSHLQISISMSQVKNFDVDTKALHQLLNQATEKGFRVTLRK